MGNEQIFQGIPLTICTSATTLLFIIQIFSLFSALTACPENQHYDPCGTACPLTCQNYKSPPVVCAAMCVPGCHCDVGHVKARDGSCVKTENCSMEANTCPENQHYDSCGTACPLTCKNYKSPPVVCAAMCVPECHCDEGYVKTRNGSCVKPENCPKEANPCPENQHYDSCGTSCILTCENYKSPPVVCAAMCVPECHCDEGYVKTRDGRCVKPENCPMEGNQVCQENQQYMQCGTACPLTCANFDNPPRICPAMCVSGCHCLKGFVKSADGSCVRPENCLSRSRKVCQENQQYMLCGTACPLTCDNFDEPPKSCLVMCVSECQCVKGFVKTADGRCVRPENCPSRSKNVEKTCLSEPDHDTCRGYFPMYYYDVTTGTCKVSIYGGCQTNGNNYDTEEECLSRCKA